MEEGIDNGLHSPRNVGADEESSDAGVQGLSEAVSVVIRVRPTSHSEVGHKKAVSIQQEDNSIKVESERHQMVGKFNRVFAEASVQEEVYSFIRPRILDVVTGISTTIFAYGQTGTGKTHTMLGPDLDDLLENNLFGYGKSQFTQATTAETTNGFSHWGDVAGKDKDAWGIIPRAVTDLFDTIHKANLRHGSTGEDRPMSASSNASDETSLCTSEYASQAPPSPSISVYCSYLQIYNDKLFDLLRDKKRRNPLVIRENVEKDKSHIFVQGLSEYKVESAADVLELLWKGNDARAVRGTEYNAHSSRSHAILQLSVHGRSYDGKGRTIHRRAKLNLVDLAGSEKWNVSTSATPLPESQTKELKNINSSLSALGNCIAALAEKKRKHVPYRDSTLTRLLQSSLGGNTRTVVIATISPSILAADETARTLHFAGRAAQVVSRVSVNETVSDAVLLSRARKQIYKLRRKLEELTDEKVNKLKADLEYRVQELMAKNLEQTELIEKLKQEKEKFVFMCGQEQQRAEEMQQEMDLEDATSLLGPTTLRTHLTPPHTYRTDARRMRMSIDRDEDLTELSIMSSLAVDSDLTDPESINVCDDDVSYDKAVAESEKSVGSSNSSFKSGTFIQKYSDRMSVEEKLRSPLSVEDFSQKVMAMGDMSERQSLSCGKNREWDESLISQKHGQSSPFTTSLPTAYALTSSCASSLTSSTSKTPSSSSPPPPAYCLSTSLSSPPPPVSSVSTSSSNRSSSCGPSEASFSPSSPSFFLSSSLPSSFSSTTTPSSSTSFSSTSCSSSPSSSPTFHSTPNGSSERSTLLDFSSPSPTMLFPIHAKATPSPSSHSPSTSPSSSSSTSSSSPPPPLSPPSSSSSSSLSITQVEGRIEFFKKTIPPAESLTNHDYSSSSVSHSVAEEEGGEKFCAAKEEDREDVSQTKTQEQEELHETEKEFGEDFCETKQNLPPLRQSQIRTDSPREWKQAAKPNSKSTTSPTLPKLSSNISRLNSGELEGVCEPHGLQRCILCARGSSGSLSQRATERKNDPILTDPRSENMSFSSSTDSLSTAGSSSSSSTVTVQSECAVHGLRGCVLCRRSGNLKASRQQARGTNSSNSPTLPKSSQLDAAEAGYERRQGRETACETHKLQNCVLCLRLRRFASDSSDGSDGSGSSSSSINNHNYNNYKNNSQFHAVPGITFRSPLGSAESHGPLSFPFSATQVKADSSAMASRSEEFKDLILSRHSNATLPPLDSRPSSRGLSSTFLAVKESSQLSADALNNLSSIHKKQYIRETYSSNQNCEDTETQKQKRRVKSKAFPLPSQSARKVRGDKSIPASPYGKKHARRKTNQRT